MSHHFVTAPLPYFLLLHVNSSMKVVVDFLTVRTEMELFSVRTNTEIAEHLPVTLAGVTDDERYHCELGIQHGSPVGFDANITAGDGQLQL